CLSDWSSDVCSSDLSVHQRASPPVGISLAGDPPGLASPTSTQLQLNGNSRIFKARIKCGLAIYFASSSMSGTIAESGPSTTVTRTHQCALNLIWARHIEGLVQGTRKNVVPREAAQR